VSGEIIESQLKWRTGLRRWTAEIRYRYTVEGLTYEGDRFGFGKNWSSSSREAVERALAMYPKGRIVTLLVSPSARSAAVIGPWVGRGVVMKFLTGALLVALGIGAFLR